MNYFQKRKTCRNAEELLHVIRHVRHMREDILSSAALEQLNRAESGLRAAMDEKEWVKLEAACTQAVAMLQVVNPPRPHREIRENIEMLAVALTVAMAFRAYFFQPFKIPTGSMQPTLFGIQVSSNVAPTVLDRWPLKPLKWLVTGKWYGDMRAENGGVVATDAYPRQGELDYSFFIGSQRYHIPRDAYPYLRVRHGDVVAKGAQLWRGVKMAGDHVLVDKIRWNFTKPKRGSVMVFKTDGIGGQMPPNMHYIKRMCGLPNETLQIVPPNLVIDGKAVRDVPSIMRVAKKMPGYAGYQLAPYSLLPETNACFRLAGDQYFALGDNTGNSWDGRYWGAVPQQNLVGPAVFVYWPFSSRWGKID
jgi:signal peptidase I